MNEAENPNHKAVNESLNAPDSPSSQQAMCPFYSVIPQQKMAIPQLPPASEVAATEPLTIDIAVNKDAPQTDWVAEPDREKQALVDAEFQKLLELNAELRTDNDNLYQQLEQLKQALADTEEALQLHKKRSSVTESMFSQQTQELSAAQEQIKTLFADLDTAVQNAQRQEGLVENYKAHLELNQQRLAQLERECAVVQANYDEQAHRLMQSENNCRELRTRLMRQQRQTLQFKAALEKCLDAPVPTTDFLEDIDRATNNFDRNSNCSQAASVLFSHTQPIQPWSADTESGADDLHHTWEELCLSSADDIETELETESGSTQSVNWHFEPTPPSNTRDSSTDNSESNAVVDDISTNHPWDEKLDRAIQALLANQNLSTLELEELEAIPTGNFSNASLNSNTPGSTLSTTGEEEIDASTIADNVENTQSIVPIVETVDNHPITPIVETIESPATEDYWSDVPQVSPLDVLDNTQSDNSWTEYSEEQGSPSPVVYPQRPPKGRKSLASVELPNFPSGK